MSTNLASASIKSSGSSTTRTLGARFADIVNVKDYGAVGNAVADDTAAIQAAIAAAFPIPGSSFTNKPLYFPAGNYLITSPLELINVAGAKIYGAGTSSTQLFLQVAGTEGNDVSDEHPDLTPLWMMDGFSYSEISDMGWASNTSTAPPITTLVTNGTTAAGNAVLHFASTTGVSAGMSVYDQTAPSVISGVVLSKTSTTVTIDTNASGAGVGSGDTIHFVASTVGAYVYQSGDNGYTGGNTFRNINVANFGTGILGGSGPGNCDNCTLHNVQFNTCALAGLRLISANALNWAVFGGGASGCASASTFGPFLGSPNAGNYGAAYSVVSGSVSLLTNMSTTGNEWSVINGGAQGMNIIGGRFEDFQAVAAAGSGIFMSGVIYGGGDSTDGCRWLNLTFSGVIDAQACVFGPANTITPATGRIADLGNNGILTLHQCSFENHADECGISGASSALVRITDCYGSAIPTASTLFGSYTGTVEDYTGSGTGVLNIAVGSLPAAAAKFKGLRGSVTDANATTFMSTVAAGGSNIVPVFCDGTNWKIG